MLTLRDYANSELLENTPDYAWVCKLCDFAKLTGEASAEMFEDHYRENHPFELSILRHR